MLNFDEIAGEAVDEVFGSRGRARPAVRAVRAIRRGRARRDYERAGWGSPGWQAAQAESYDPYAQTEASYDDYDPGLDFEDDGDDDDSDDELGDEFGGGEEYGLVESDTDEVLDSDDEEFGRRPRPVRRAVKRFVKHRMKKHRQRRQARKSGGSSGMSTSAAPVPTYRPLMPMVAAELPDEDEDGFDPGITMSSVSKYGFLPEPSRDTLLMDSVKMGLGVGIGLTVVTIGVNLIARGLR